MHGARNYIPIKVPNSNVSKFNEVEEFSSRDEKKVDELVEKSIFSPIIKNETIRTEANDIQFREETEMKEIESKVQQINIKRTKNSSPTANLISPNKLSDKENTRTTTERDNNQAQRCISYKEEASDALENSTELLDGSLTQIPSQFVSNKSNRAQVMNENSFVVRSKPSQTASDEIANPGIRNDSLKNDSALKGTFIEHDLECNRLCSKDTEARDKNVEIVRIPLIYIITYVYSQCIS